LLSAIFSRASSLKYALCYLRSEISVLPYVT
jgi:hypothetical protein